MLKFYWGIVLTIAMALVGAPMIWMLVAPTPPMITPSKAEPAPVVGYLPGGGPCQPQAIARLTDTIRASSQRDRCLDLAEAHRLQVANLQQQKRAADAAESQSWLAYQNNRIASFALVGGFLTLLAAAAAAAYARQAGHAARDGLRHAKDVSSMELRPYLEFSRVRVHNRDSLSEVVISIENFGRTPATISMLEAGHALISLNGKFDLPKIRDSRFDPRSIAPGHTIESHHRSLLRKNNISKVLSDQNRIVLYVRIKYTDFAKTFEDSLERAWLIRKEHLAGGLSLARVHKSRHLKIEDILPNTAA